MKHILVHRESRLQQVQTASTSQAAFGWMSLASSPWFRLLWLTGLAVALFMGTALAQVGGTAPSADFDGDGVINSIDQDDDNDGILDIIESPGCYYTEAEAITLINVTSAITVFSSGNPVWARTNAIDGNLTTPTAFVVGPTPITNVEIYRVTPTSPVAISSLNLVKYPNDPLSSNAASTMRLEGFNGTSWVPLSVAAAYTISPPATTTISIANTLQPGVAFQQYRLYGVAGTVGYGSIYEITLTASAYDPQSHPKFSCTGNNDVDGDFFPNHLDVNSDGDACSDANEYYATTSADGGDGGIYGTGTPAINSTTGRVLAASYTGSYANAINPAVCLFASTGLSQVGGTGPSADFDGDGVINSIDQDDDNDGILDIIESPGCYYTEAEAIKLTAVTSAIAVFANPSWIRPNAIDGILTTPTAFVIGPTAITNVEVYRVVPTTPVAISSFNLIKTANDPLSSNAASTMRLEGFNGTSWVPLSVAAAYTISPPATTTITITNTLQPGVVFQEYRLFGISGTVGYGSIYEITLTASAYDPQSHPKVTCTGDNDADDDFIPNHLDLDSDGDGCSDANEYYASKTADGGDGGTYSTGTPAINSTTGKVLLASYTGNFVNATIASVAVCNTEVCGDGIDNDGDGYIDTYDPDCPCLPTATGFFGVCPPDCEYNPNPTNPFTIKKAFSTSSANSNLVHVYQSPLVGDVDADGKTDFVIPSANSLGGYLNGYYSLNIHVFNGQTGALKNTINTNAYVYNGSEQSLVMGNTDTSDPQAEIYAMTGANYAITMYKANGTQVWRNAANLPYAGTLYNPTTGSAPSSAMGLADFNGDGIAELYILNKIYNAVTGNLLLDGTALFGSSSGVGLGNTFNGVSVAANLTTHPGLELAAGNSIYEITITNSNGTAGNTMVEKRLADVDGPTAIADIDLDGQLDVIVRSQTRMYIYNPRTMVLMASVSVPLGSGVPFIGDVDNDGAPEIGITSSLILTMYEYNGTSSLATKWQITTSDVSGGTGITMFDFNQDGQQELVYRDETNLRIMNGATGVNLATIPSFSGTGGEMPVVADVDDDGQANILVTSGPGSLYGVVDIFSTNSFPWSPARKVWNQSAYHVTNVNDDLTIPKNEQSNAITFPNGKRILNNFRQQVSTYDKDGEYVFPAINVKVKFTPDALEGGTGYSQANSSYYKMNCVSGSPTSVTLTIPLINSGNTPTPVNMPVSIYVNDPFNSGSALLVQTITIPSAITALGGSYTATTTLNTTGFPANFKLYVVPGDPGATAPFPKTFSSYFQGLGLCAAQSNVGVYGEFSCACPTITNVAANNTNPTTCGGTNGSINVCGLTPGGTGYILNYTKNGIAQPASTSLTADASGCLSLTGLGAGIYDNIRVSNAACLGGSNLIGPITLTAPGAPVAPTVSATSLTICSGGQVNLTYTTTPAGQTVQWTRMPGNITGLGNVTDSPTTVTDTDPVSYTYTAKIVGLAGCESPTTTTVVLVNPTPIITPSVCSQTICAGQTGSIAFAATIPGTVINWLRVEDGATGTGNISSVFNTPGTFTYKVWGTSPAPATCPTSTTITCTVVVNPGLTVTASVAAGVGCIGSPLSLSASVSSIGTYTYTWAGPNGYIGTGANPLVTPTSTAANNGSYTVTVTDVSGCSGTATVPVSVSNCCNVTAGASSNSPVCPGGTLQLSASGGISYTWFGPNGFTQTGQTVLVPGVTSVNAGSYTVVVTDATGCTATTTTTVVVPPPGACDPSCPNPLLSYAGQPLCTNGVATPTYSPLGGGFAASPMGLVIDPVSGVLNLNASAAGTYTVTYTVQEPTSGCIRQVQTYVTVAPTPYSNAVTTNGGN